ncbi:MAG TPA: hypothetical protein VJT12_08265 [Methyloceanibacter sp.]|nr:hypothetical protein [Methyloceanibacter sp.]
MKLLRAALKAAVVVVLSLLFIDAAKTGPAEIQSDAGVISMVATVQAIDVTNQIVTVVGPNNNWVEVKVKPEHIKLIKLKERITISYADEVAVGLRKLDRAPAADSFAQDEEAGMSMNAPTVTEQDWVEATPQGATDLTTIEITDTVAAIDRNQRTITFAGTGGKTRTIAIGPAVQGFNMIEVGDDVALLVTRAVAIDVKPA